MMCASMDVGVLMGVESGDAVDDLAGFLGGC